MDVEVAAKAGADGRDRFRRALAVVIGASAILAALLGTFETADSKAADRASFAATRLGVDVYGRETVRQMVADSAAAAAEQARVASAEAAAAPVPAIAAARAAAAARLAAFATSIGAVPGPSSGVDPITRDAMASDESVLAGLEARIAEQLADARRAGSRRSRAVFALSLVALAAVLAGLAAVVGGGRGGVVCLVLAAGALVVAAGWGVTSVPT